MATCDGADEGGQRSTNTNMELITFPLLGKVLLNPCCSRRVQLEWKFREITSTCFHLFHPGPHLQPLNQFICMQPGRFMPAEDIAPGLALHSEKL